jgi:serine/threonine protein kinase
VLEPVAGEPLQSFLGRSSKLAVDEVLDIGAELAAALARLHAAGWVWRDCKPANLIRGRAGMTLIDFEGAARLGAREIMPWTTPGYQAPELREAGTQRCRESDDVYSMGVTIHQLLSGHPRPGQATRPIGSFRRGVPRAVRSLLGAMLSPEAARRPAATEVAQALATAR